MCFDSRQLGFDFVYRVDEDRMPLAVEGPTDEDDDPLISAPMVQRTVSAATTKHERGRAPVSVFDLAQSPIAVKLEGHDTKGAIYRISHVDGVTRCARMREQDTEEWQEKEAARRARQKPPRPQRQKFKMRNSRTWADDQK